MSRGERVALAAVLAAAFALRLWSASVGLHANRYFDERFSFENVAMVLRHGTLRPDNAFYGGLSYLPHAGLLWVSRELHEATGAGLFAVHGPRGTWTPTAYFLVRLVSVVAGTLNVALAFALGRRLFSVRTGLTAALLLAAFPRHVLSSTEFKPDVVTALFVALTFLWATDAAREPRPRSLAKAGAGVGLAVASKYTGVGVAVPLAVGVLWGRLREARTWLLLGVAGVASLAAWIVFNPHVDVVLRYLPRIWGIMETKGEAVGGSHLAVLREEVEYFARHHGPLVTPFVVAGLLGLAGRLVRGADAERRRQAAMFLSFTLGYPLVYAAATSLFKGQNLLPVTTFTSLAGAWAMAGLARRAVERRPSLRRPAAAAAAALVAGGVLLAPTARWVYETTTPTTLDVAQKLLQRTLKPLELRTGFYERRDLRLRPSTARGHFLALAPVERLADVPARALDLADVEVFWGERLETPPRDAATQPYLRRLVREPIHVVRVDPEPFVAHGSPLVVVFHPWRATGDPLPMTPVGGDGAFTATLDPPAARGEAVSISLWVPKAGGDGRLTAVVQGDRLDLPITRRGGRRVHRISERLPLPHGTTEVTLALAPARAWPRPPEATLLRWQPYDGSRLRGLEPRRRRR